ncbi:hypothetical protein [Acetobacter tropicalis]|uniref:hypothetical protein n=1 Tax=Acetobacter tropicalis TaxID=104102 RepID=UPI000554979D|nr:hypothetical protein [Acetobacter tropicalis]MDO8173220.1 hypothetical protein [Acetobacter tropicalis]
MNSTDQLPRVFQANAHRFYQRVIVATLDQLPMHGALITGEMKTFEKFAGNCAAQVDNYIANEAIKAFSLTFDGMFERQLRRWVAGHDVKVGNNWGKLLKECAKIGSLDLTVNEMADDLEEMHLVANVVRHGDGRSCQELKAQAPSLWDSPSLDYSDVVPGPTPVSDNLRVRPNDLLRYARAVFRFWGNVDRLPHAALNPPY